MKIRWLILDDFQLDPQDGEDLIEYWWEDMRPSEVRRLLQETYERGVRYGMKKMFPDWIPDSIK